MRVAQWVLLRTWVHPKEGQITREELHDDHGEKGGWYTTLDYVP
jgi:hypothetical protein